MGDRLRDVEPAQRFGGRGILVARVGPRHTRHRTDPSFRGVTDLRAAVETVLARLAAPLPSPAMTMRVAVAVSGRGSNLEALLRALGPTPLPGWFSC